MTPAALQVVLVDGTGFLGRRLRKRLPRSGHAVTVIGRGPSVRHDGGRREQCDAATDQAVALAVGAQS